jgi:WD40-like Beta Propeller Repeat
VSILRSSAGLFPLLLIGCRGTLSPLSNKIEVGQQPYLIFAADGEDGLGDLFASALTGGQSFQITFTRVDEALPSLSPDGTMLAFTRSRAPDDPAHRLLVVMNLLSGAERQVDVDGAAPTALAWSADGTRIFLRQGDMVRMTSAPPVALRLDPIAGGDRVAADSQLAVLLGDPPLATAVPCENNEGICAILMDGSRQTITRTGTDPARWSGDSIVYHENEAWVIRPLAGGKTRTLSLASVHPRSLTLFAGRPRVQE